MIKLFSLVTHFGTELNHSEKLERLDHVYDCEKVVKIIYDKKKCLNKINLY